MSATIYQYGRDIGIVFDDSGPLYILTEDGTLDHRYSIPAEAEVLLSTNGEPFSSYDEGYEQGYADAHRHAITAVEGMV